MIYHKAQNKNDPSKDLINKTQKNLSRPNVTTTYKLSVQMLKDSVNRLSIKLNISYFQTCKISNAASHFDEMQLWFRHQITEGNWSQIIPPNHPFAVRGCYADCTSLKHLHRAHSSFAYLIASLGLFVQYIQTHTYTYTRHTRIEVLLLSSRGFRRKLSNLFPAMIHTTTLKITTETKLRSRNILLE